MLLVVKSKNMLVGRPLTAKSRSSPSGSEKISSSRKKTDSPSSIVLSNRGWDRNGSLLPVVAPAGTTSKKNSSKALPPRPSNALTSIRYEPISRSVGVPIMVLVAGSRNKLVGRPLTS